MLPSESFIFSSDPKSGTTLGASPGASHDHSRKESVPIFVDRWEGQGKASKVLLIVHGLGEHGGRYKHFPDYLGECFDRFYAMDQRGHGRSGGLRGFAPRFASFHDDLKRVIQEIESREQGKKLTLFAHSFGGLVALSYLLKEKTVPFEKAIISAPLLGVALRVPEYKRILGEILGRTVASVQLTNEVNPSHLTHDPAVVEAYVKDRLVHAKITPRLYLDMTAEMQWVLLQSGPLACKTLFLVAGDDRIVSSPKILEFYRNLKFRDKDLREYPGMFHEVVNEIDKKKVFEDMKSWLAR